MLFLLGKRFLIHAENYAKQRQPGVREVLFIVKASAELPVLPVFPWRMCPCQVCVSVPSAIPALGELCQHSGALAWEQPSLSLLSQKSQADRCGKVLVDTVT